MKCKKRWLLSVEQLYGFFEAVERDDSALDTAWWTDRGLPPSQMYESISYAKADFLKFNTDGFAGGKSDILGRKGTEKLCRALFCNMCSSCYAIRSGV
ncbi:Uncharacterized protein TCM_019917 [Theobroma cacao]|uniref:Uncharacterized protein n=1 Tax=Theobroma cacao TaxID=3641 RepID=A0A061EIB7_THECC|nr:Uncharacterized protein TCM_019917 [Theobroma cacao]